MISNLLNLAFVWQICSLKCHLSLYLPPKRAARRLATRIYFFFVKRVEFSAAFSSCTLSSTKTSELRQPRPRAVTFAVDIL